jgi:hypothetical protein
MTIAARKVAAFKPSKELSARMNGVTDAAEGAGETTADIVAQPSEGSAKSHGDKINV